MADSNMLDIIRGIAQAALNANSIPGFTYKGRVLEPNIGLKRDRELSIHDKRIHDGFKVRFRDNLLYLSYQSDIELREMYEKGKFEDEMESVMKDVVSFLKKEYRSAAGKNLSLVQEG